MAVIEAAFERATALLCCSKQGARFVLGARQGLFTEHVLARFERRDGDLRVRIRVRQHQDRADLRIGDRDSPIRGDLSTERLSESFGSLFIAIDDERELVVAIVYDGSAAALRLQTSSDDCNLLHLFTALAVTERPKP